MTSKSIHKDVDAYLADVRPDFRAALDHVRALIRHAAPAAQEAISYGIPTYKLDGPLIGFGAASKHCAVYGMSPKVLEHFAADLKDFSTSPGTIRFTPDRPIPDQLILDILDARIAENAAIVAARKAKKTKDATRPAESK